MKTTYLFKIFIDLPSEAGISLTNTISFYPIEFNKVAIKKEGNKFSEAQLKNIKAKLENLYKNKFNFTAVKVELSSIID